MAGVASRFRRNDTAEVRNLQSCEYLMKAAVHRDQILEKPCTCIVHSSHLYTVCQITHRTRLLEGSVPTKVRYEAEMLAVELNDKLDQPREPAQIEAIKQFRRIAANLGVPGPTETIPFDISTVISMDMVEDIFDSLDAIFFNGYLKNVGLRPWNPTMGEFNGPVAFTFRPMADLEHASCAFNPVMTTANGFPPLANSQERFEFFISMVLHEMVHALFLEHGCHSRGQDTPERPGKFRFCSGGDQAAHGRPFQLMALTIEQAGKEILGFKPVLGRAVSLYCDVVVDEACTPSQCDLVCWKLTV